MQIASISAHPASAVEAQQPRHFILTGFANRILDVFDYQCRLRRFPGQTAPVGPVVQQFDRPFEAVTLAAQVTLLQDPACGMQAGFGIIVLFLKTRRQAHAPPAGGDVPGFLCKDRQTV